MESPAVLVKEVEVVVDGDRAAFIRDVLGPLGVVRGLTDEDALTLRLAPAISYRDAVRRLQQHPEVRAIYCHHPIATRWKASRPLPPDAEADLDAATHDFGAVPESARVAKGIRPRRRGGGLAPANVLEDEYVIVRPPGQQYFTLPPPGFSYWREIGPRGFGAGATRWAGRVDAIAIHPSNPDIFYVGASKGGVWRTGDGGKTYAPLSDRWDSLAILSVAVDGSHQPETVFVGKGGSDPTLLRSDDAGASFQPVHPELFADRDVKDVLVVPDSPGTVLAAVSGSNGYIYRSVDGGHQFAPVLTDIQGNSLQGSWRQLKGGIKTGPTRYLYALGTTGDPAHTTIAWSTDAGATWTRTGCPTNDSLAELAPSQTVTATVYYYSPSNRTVWKSSFAGAVWGAIYLPGTPPWDDEDTPMFDQPAANTMIGVARRVVNGVAGDAVYVGGVGLMRTTNNGSSWEQLDAGHSDYCCFVLQPGGAAFLLGTHGGVFEGTDLAIPGGSGAHLLNFSPRNDGLGITQFYTGAFSTTSPLGIVGGTQDNGTVSRVDSDDWRLGSNNDGGAVALSPVSNDVQFGSDQDYRVYRTATRWATHENITIPYGKLLPGPKWDADKTPGLGSGTFELDPNTGAELYAGTNYLYRYTLATGLWTRRVAGIKFAGDGIIQDIKVAQGDSQRIYVAGDAGLWMSQDHGTTWTRIDISAVGHPSSLPGSTMVLSLHPDNKNDVVAIVRPPTTDQFASPPWKLYRCANTTAYPRVWTELSTIGGASALARDFDDPDGTFYLSSGLGVSKSIDGGQTWTPYDYDLGLPVLTCKTIVAVPATRSLYLATYGRGFWRLQLPTVTLGLEMPAGVEMGRQVTATVTLGRKAQPGGENVRVTTNIPGDGGRRITVRGGVTGVGFSLETTRLPAGQRQLEVRVAVGSSSLVRTIEVAPVRS